jgi:hypothetical protein
MAKRCLLVLTLLSLCAFSAFSLSSGNNEKEKNELNENNENNKKNSVSLDVYLLGIGVRYERFLSPELSVGADVYSANLFFSMSELEAGVFARYYPWRGLYMELGLGYHGHFVLKGFKSESFGIGTVSDVVVTSGVAVSPGLGWKFDPGKTGGFFVKPGIGVPITIGEKKSFVHDKAEFGVSVGFVVYCGLGWAF